MRRLVTGGAGCIGSDLAAALAACGDEVVVLDNLSSGKIEHLAGLLDRPGFRLIEGDLSDIAMVDAAMEGVEMVYHLAATASSMSRRCQASISGHGRSSASCRTGRTGTGWRTRWTPW